jgi:uncharacterized RDD family membrane protein YckC
VETEDPYRSPSTEVVDAPLVSRVESATKVRRFFNWLIDKLVVLGLVALATILALLSGNEAVVEWLDNIDTLTDYAITYAMFLAYYGLMEGLFGFTLGKLVTSTRVVDAQGRRITLARGMLRSLCRLIPFDALSLLLSDDDVRRAWHDSITGTYVVRRTQQAHTRAGQGFTTSDSTTMSST